MAETFSRSVQYILYNSVPLTDNLLEHSSLMSPQLPCVLQDLPVCRHYMAAIVTYCGSSHFAIKTKLYSMAICGPSSRCHFYRATTVITCGQSRCILTINQSLWHLVDFPILSLLVCSQCDHL